MMKPSFDLSGRAVTGADTGIGQPIAVALSGAGAAVLGVGRSGMSETEALIASAGGRFASFSGDLSTIEQVDGIVEAAVSTFGSVDSLVNNAGIIRRADAIDFTEGDWDAVMDGNLKSAFFLSQAAAKHMIPSGRGKIIDIASMLSFQGGIRILSYTASRSGLAGLTRLLACEWAAKGINVNAIAPGYFVTNNTTALREDPKRSGDILGRIPCRPLG